MSGRPEFNIRRCGVEKGPASYREGDISQERISAYVVFPRCENLQV